MKATGRIKFGKPKDTSKLGADQVRRDKSHLSVIEAGESVPKDAHLDEATVNAVTDAGEDFEPAFDPEDPSSYGGAEAARHSRLMAPDNPNRPRAIQGEESFKVADGGAFGRLTRSPLRSGRTVEDIDPDEDLQRLTGGTVQSLGRTIGEVPPTPEDERAKGTHRRASKRSSGGAGQASGQSATGSEGNEDRE
jgi:hypothetical protein